MRSSTSSSGRGLQVSPIIIQSYPTSSDLIAPSTQVRSFGCVSSVIDQTTTPETNSPSPNVDEDSNHLCRYLVDLVVHIRNSDSIRGKQSRLTMWEILEHFDFLNGEYCDHLCRCTILDLFFICRVGMMTQEPRFLENPLLQRIGSICESQISQ